MTCVGRLLWPGAAVAADSIPSSGASSRLMAALFRPSWGLSTPNQMLNTPIPTAAVVARAIDHISHPIQPTPLLASTQYSFSRPHALHRIFNSNRHQQVHAGICSAGLHSLSSAAAQPPATKGQQLTEIDTPALLVDLDGKIILLQGLRKSRCWCQFSYVAGALHPQQQHPWHAHGSEIHVDI